MSEKEETKKNEGEDQSESKETDIVDDKVTLLIAELDSQKSLNAELAVQLDLMTKKYENAKAYIEKETRASLINKIAPRTRVPKEVLSVMDIEKLKNMDAILSDAKIVVKSGTPITVEKDSPEAKLANMFDDFASKTWRKS
jgi:hypothetical protein